jgi:hypothetical protein
VTRYAATLYLAWKCPTPLLRSRIMSSSSHKRPALTSSPGKMRVEGVLD